MSFDRIAPHYRWIEWICAGPLLQCSRTTFVREIPEPRRALIIGEGNGRFLAEFLQEHPAARATCVDASAVMLRLAQARLQKHGLDLSRVEFVHANALDWAPPRGQFDLIVTHFFFDCFPYDQLEQIVAMLAAAATPGAQWLVADFREPASGFAKIRAHIIIQSLYLFFRCVARLPSRRLTPPDELLAHHGFVLRERRIWDCGLLHSDLWCHQ